VVEDHYVAKPNGVDFRREIMASVPAPQPADSPALTVLAVPERRILGVLVEKAKTTPDAYPLSVNALVTGSNQKSARDPLLNLSEYAVEDALLSAQQKGLVLKITGGRVERWRHNLYDAWQVDKVELAVLAELLLRGPQTEGELRSRASRMEPIDDLEALRAVLHRLAERGLAVYLSPEGRRGTVVTHGFHSPQELERLRGLHAAEAPAAAAEEGPAAAPPGGRIEALEAQMAEALGEIAALRSELTALKEQVSRLRQALGE
jgi:uncharacterized protein YceH (UPF0502 family)